MTQATAVANGESTGTTGQAIESKADRRVTLEERLERKLAVARRYRGAIRFFKSRRWLLSSSEHAPEAGAALRRAQRRLAQTQRSIRAIRHAIGRRDARRRAAMPPRAAICDVFGRRFCRAAVTVAWCESRLTTSARNGQYLGLFQMGSTERRLFGHGSTAHAQATAAHRYFVLSGRDWSPWGCKPWY